MPGHRVEAIANEFIRRAQAEGHALTNMKLQKLPYIAHGWGLVINREELVNEEPWAWPYGPVYPRLYNQLKKYGAASVTDFIHEHDDNPFRSDRGEIITANLTDAEVVLLDAVWNAYKSRSAFELSTLTHQDDSPWTVAQTQHPNGVISNVLIERHYRDLAERRRAKTES